MAGILTIIAVSAGVFLLILWLIFPKITERKVKNIPKKMQFKIDRKQYLAQKTAEYQQEGMSERDASRKAIAELNLGIITK